MLARSSATASGLACSFRARSTAFFNRAWPIGLSRVVDRAGLERLNGVLIEGGNNDDDRKRVGAELAHHFEAAHHGHLEIEEDEVGFESRDFLERVAAVLGLAGDVDVWKQLELLAQHAAGDGFVIDDQGLHA